MDVDEARSVLGLKPGDGWEAVRPAYRRLIQEMHPDRAGPTSTHRAARVNEAYMVLVRAKRAQASPTTRPGRAPSPQPARPTAKPTGSAPPPRHTAGTQVDGAYTLLLEVPFQEAFARLLAASDSIGDVSYVDRSSGIFEVVVQHQGEACSLLVTLVPPSTPVRGTEVIFVLEALSRVASPSPAPVVRNLLSSL